MERAALPTFFLKAAASLFLLTAAWYFVADVAAVPAGWIAKTVAQTVFSDLVRHGDARLGAIEVETFLRLSPAQLHAQAVPQGTQAFIVAEVRPAKYGYSLPLLFALLLSGSRRRLARNLLVGAVCLVPLQAFSIVMHLLKMATFSGGVAVAAQTGWSQWQLEAVAFGYQLGVLLAPTVGSVLLWLWLDRTFLASHIMAGWLGTVSMRKSE